MNYPGGFGILKAATFYTVVTLEGMLKSKSLQMDPNTRAELVDLLEYVKSAVDRADDMAENGTAPEHHKMLTAEEAKASEPYCVSPDHGVIETKEQFDALMDEAGSFYRHFG